MLRLPGKGSLDMGEAKRRRQRVTQSRTPEPDAPGVVAIALTFDDMMKAYAAAEPHPRRGLWL
jgi:hypothetical protein